MDKSTIVFWTFVLFWIVGSVLYFYASKDFHIEQVECFDENNNKINELTCDKKITNPSLLKTSYPICFGISIAFIVYSLYLVFKEGLGGLKNG